MNMRQASRIPASWAEATISELAEVNPRLDKNGLPDDLQVSFVPMAAVEEESGRMDASCARPLVEVRKGYTPFRAGDVLMAKITPCMENGKIVVAPEVLGGLGFGSTEFHVLRPMNGIRPDWLRFYLAQRSYRRDARLHMTGSAGQLRVPAEFVANSVAPVAPTAEQNRIIAEIEKQFSRLDAGVAALMRVEKNLKRYKASVLKAACEGRLTAAWRAAHPDLEPASELLKRILRDRRRRWEEAELAKLLAKGKPPKDDRWKERYEEPAAAKSAELPALPRSWCWVTAEQLTPFDRPAAYGVLQPGPDFDDGVEFVRVCDIQDGRVLREQLKRISPKIAANYPRTKLRGSEVLVTLVGTIGRSAVAPDELAGANTARAVGVIPVTDHVTPHFVELCFRNSTKVVELTNKSHEVARKTLNLEDVRATCLPLPPYVEQVAIVEAVEDAFSLARAAEEAVITNLRRAMSLRQAVLRDAFEGKLVEQDPHDEPASVLLDRIRAARQAPTAQQGRPRRGENRPRKTVARSRIRS